MPIETTEAFRVLLCEILLEGPGGRRVVTCPDALLTQRGIQEGDAVQLLADGTLQKLP